MAVNKLTPRYLNKDDDSRLVKSTEMTDALNIRVSFDDDGDGLVVKNAYGNQEITLVGALPSGTNKVIGSTPNEQNGAIYYYVWNSNTNHCIYRYSVGANTSTKVYSDSVLAFTENGFVKGNVITSIDGDELLYFNDSVTAPKKINASKALRGQYPAALTSGTDEEKLLCLTVAKQPPLSPPTFTIVNNPSLKTNNISDKVFQFAYRYIYEDGETSALSPYSSLTTSVAQLRDGFNTQSARDFYNQVNVFVRNTIADVDNIEVFAREGNEGTFYEIAEKTNNKNTNAVTITFNNQFKGEALSINDKNKLFDNVPQQADSQETVSGRLMYGGYTEGYPNTNPDVNLIANYKDTEDIYNITVQSITSSGVADTGTTIATFNYDSFPSVFTEESTAYINTTITGDTITVNGGGGEADPLDFSEINISVADLDGSNAESFALSDTKEPVDFIPSGIFLNERIIIPANTSKANAKALVKSRLLDKKYNLMLAPTRDQNVVFASGGTAFSNFTALVTGRAIVTTINGNDGSGDAIAFRMDKLEMYIGASDTKLAPLKALKNLLIQDGSISREIANLGGLKEAAGVVFAGGKQRVVVAAAIIDIDSNVNGLRYKLTAPTATGVMFASATKDSATKSFKSGSSHKMGIVYYDNRNRSGGVQELGEVYIESLNNRSSENNLDGAASVVMRLPDAAPSWARKWAPVYKGIGSSKLKLMYSLDGAFVPFRTDAKISGTSVNKKIYLSLNSVFGPTIGYNQSTGANLNYEFKKGDRLRVLEYEDGTRTSLEFKVLGYDVLSADENNPILDTSAERTVERTTGSFLIVEEDAGATDFNIASILNRTTNWNKKCVVEIYNIEGERSDIYYELGKGYDVLNSVHSDERVSSTGISVTVSSVSGASNNEYFGNTSVKVFKGDVISVNSIKLNILNTYERGGVLYYYGDTRTINGLSVGSYTGASVDNPEKVIDLSLGDVYFRKRALYSSTANEKIISGQLSNIPSIAMVKYIESYSVSDFFASKSSSIGRPIAYIPNAATVKRSGSITYSEPYLQEGTFNGLSSFNLSLANFKDLAYEHGAIKGLISYNERLYFIQENRSGVLAVNRNVIQTGSGDNLISLSNNVLQAEQYYVGEYGTSNSESIASRDGMVYFADIKRGKVLRIDSQGLTVISDVNLSTYFDDKFGIISNYQPSTVIGGIDKDNDEYIVSADAITEATVAINTNQFVYKAQLDSSNTKVLAPITINDLAVFSFNTDVRNFNESCDEFQDSLESIVFLDTLSDGGSIFTVSNSESLLLYGIATNSTYDFFVSITVDTSLPGFVFNNSYCNSDDVGSINAASTVLNAFNIAYSTDDRVWSTRYSYTPESIVSVHSGLYTFKSGKIYAHNENAGRNTFYGAATAESIVEAVSNISPSSIKVFESISLEGDTPWQTTVTTTDQTATLAGTLFVDPVTTPNGVWREKEGFYYAYIHGDTTAHGAQISSVTSTSEIFSLGVVASTDVNSIIFNNAVNTIAFPLGSTAALYKVNVAQSRLDSLSVYPLSVTAQKTITFSGAASVSAGDLLVVVGNSSIEGDQIRDYFAKVKLTKTTSSPIELYAINTVIADSKLHN